MLKKLSLMGLCLALLAVATIPLAPAAHAQELTNEELLGSSVGGINLAQAQAEFERGLNADLATQLKIYRPLAKQGYGPAQYIMGLAYEAGEGGLPKNQTTADEWWRKAAQSLPQQAEAGDHWAQLSLGDMYYLGDGGLAENTATACSWWRKAATNGNEEAQWAVSNVC